MADPRLNPPAKRKDPLSALMQAKRGASQGEVVNFCPFGCEAHQLDDLGYCHHLVGFTSDKRTMEPRLRRRDGRIIVSGTKRQQVKAGDVLVKVTTSARVYRKAGVPELAVSREYEDAEEGLFDARERRLREDLEEIVNPVLDGVVLERTSYDDEDEDEDAKLEAATRPKS